MNTVAKNAITKTTMIKIISVKLNELELLSTSLELLSSDELVELLAIDASLDTSPPELDPEPEPPEELEDPELEEPWELEAEDPEPDELEYPEPEPPEELEAEVLGAELDEDTSSIWYSLPWPGCANAALKQENIKIKEINNAKYLYFIKSP